MAEQITEALEKLSVDEHVVIVGGGTFGLSTALHLLRDGYKNVSVVDQYPVPSKFSAANDVNKVVHSDYADPFHFQLGLDTLKAWKSDPVFKDYFHETGIVYTGSKERSIKAELDVRERKLGLLNLKESDLPLVKSKEDIQKYHPEVQGDFKNWQGYFQSFNCGWGHARNSLISASEEIKRLGGKFVVDGGKSFVYNDQGDVVALELQSGKKIEGSKFILTAGANSISFNLDFKNQLLAKCWTYAHIKLTPEELEKFKDTPVIVSAEYGFFFEPDSNGEIKVCNECPGFTHYVSEGESKESIPYVKEQIPLQAEEEIRFLLKTTIPQFADRPFTYARICWCTDTVDRNFLIGEHPEHKNLILGTGDSGHGFKFMPIIGKYIASVVKYGEKKGLTEEQHKRWRWRPEDAVNRDDSKLRMGGDREQQDLADLADWTHIGEELK